MEGSTEIFDRDDIMSVIRTNLIEVRQGTGAGTVILSPQKSGKSHLLSYIYDKRELQQNTFYCRISIYALSAKVPVQQKLSDEVFLIYFLKQLHDELCAYLARERATKDVTAQNLERDQARLERGEIVEEELRQLFSIRFAADNAYLVEYQSLENYRDQIAALIAKPTQADDLYEFLDEFLSRLKRMKKRIVLFIDDVQSLISDNDFSDRLLSLLRGASNDGKLVPLLATTKQLMDPSLHQDRVRRDQTRSLFNDVKVEVLNSFSPELAAKFLHWPKPPAKPLNEREQQYILDLAGGSPYFLQEVRDRYLRARPQTGPEFKQFELQVGQELENVFDIIWERCSAQHRKAIRAAEVEKVCIPGVDLGPAACFAGFGGFFSSLFQTYLAKKEDEREDLIVTATPNFRIFPSALCIAAPEALDLVSITLKNPTSSSVKVQLECELEEFSQVCRVPVTVSANGGTERKQISITPKHRAGADLYNPEPTQIRWKAVATPGSGSLLNEESTIRIRVLAIDQFVFAMRDDIANSLVNYSWMIGAWVNTEDPAVQDLMHKAAQRLPAKTAIGYPAVGGPAAAPSVEQQVEALYEAVRDKNIQYQNRTGAPYTGSKDLSQRVRLPGRSVNYGCANCLDGAVLFASLLQAFDLDPLILFLPDHSLVGWKSARGPAASPRFIEITDAAVDRNFAEASLNGQRRFENLKVPVENGEPREIKDVGNFAILVDVAESKLNHMMGTLPAQ
ncbi:MAG: ATP-binding protein [Acidobacteria bacterium]|nr:ATP-binding protein [Acidobacteriota bacterium]